MRLVGASDTTAVRVVRFLRAVPPDVSPIRVLDFIFVIGFVRGSSCYRLFAAFRSFYIRLFQNPVHTDSSENSARNRSHYYYMRDFTADWPKASRAKTWW